MTDPTIYEDGETPEEQALYTAEDMTPPVDTSKGKYPIVRTLGAIATGKPEAEEEVNFNNYVDSKWRETVPESNNIDRNVAINAATNGEVSVFQEAMTSISARNKMYGDVSSKSAADVKAKIKEMADQAVETTALRNPAVLYNNTVAEISDATKRVSGRVSAQAVLEQAIEDGGKLTNIATGLGYEFTPFAAEQGPALDRVAIKMGVPKDKISRLSGRSQTITYLQAKFNSLSEEEKGAWLDELYTNLKEGALITDWVAARVVQEVATNEEQTWGGFSDWADRLGVVGSVVTGVGAVFRAGTLLKGSSAIVKAERTLAAVGGKSALVAAESTKIASQAANAMRLRALGVVAGEATGISTAIDLAKLVSLNAAKVLPESVVIAAQDLQKIIREPVDKLIADLQDVIAAKGVRSSEAAAQLEELNTFYSKANNPHIHSVDPFTLSADGITVSGKVFYKPADASAFLTKEAAEAALKGFDPTGKLGMKVVPDTTNTGYLVEEGVLKDLKLRKAAIEAQILEVINEEKKLTKALKTSPTPPVTTDVGVTPPPKALVTSKPRWKTSGLTFETDIDKAAYQIGSKTTPSKSDNATATWLKSVTGWSDDQIKSHAAELRKYIQQNEDVVDDVGNIIVPNRIPEGKPSYSVQPSYDAQFKAYSNIDGAITVGNTTVSPSVQKSYILEFINRLGNALGMENRKVLVLQYEDIIKSKDIELKALAKHIKDKHATAGAIHFDYGSGQSIIVMKRQVGKQGTTLKTYIEDFAHEYGHAFESQFASKYFGIMNSSFNKWLRAKGISFKGDGINKVVTDRFPPEALLEYRAITQSDYLSEWVLKWANGDVAEYQMYEAAIHKWATSYSEFFAENFAKWAFTNDVPTNILGQAFAKLVAGFKLIVQNVTQMLKEAGVVADVGVADKNITAMLNAHIASLKQNNVTSNATLAAIASESKRMKPSVTKLQKELAAIDEELQAIDDATKGLKTGWLVEKPISQNIDYTNVSKYTDDDINSAARFSLGDWALSTSSELYAQRVVGINQQSRYTKLLTNFVRPSVEKLKKGEMVALNDALTLGDKEGKVFTEAELAGQGLSPNARVAYYKVRALRDVMWQMRNDVAAKSMIKRGYVELQTGITLDDGSGKLFGKATTPLDGSYVYLADKNTTQRVGKEFMEQANLEGLQFFELAEPALIDGKYRRVIAMSTGSFTPKRIEEVIPYRAGEYRRIYSDEYFVKIKSVYEVDGKMEEVLSTHRTASSVSDANAYVKVFNEAAALHAKGALTLTEASRLMQPYGWKPEDFVAALDNNQYGTNFKLEVKYNRTDDDYVNEAIGMSTNFSSKRGDKVLSVHGEDANNTLSPLDAIASEIGNTAYVASVTEWRESHVIRWFNTFVDDLPANVQSMSPDQAFAYMLNNKGFYVGQSQRLATAEKVQEYIISQLNIATKEEKEYLGFMRMISESIEGTTSNKGVAKFGAALRATKDYPTWARTIAFHSFFAFNPVQFFMQGMNAFNAVAISPIHGLKAAKSSALYGMALMSDNENIWQAVAKTNKLTNLGLGMSEEEFVEVVRAVRRSGLLDGMNTTSLYGAETGKYGIFNGVRRNIGAVSATPFNAGEGYSRLVSFDIARREWMEANPGGAWWTDDNLVKIIERQDDLTQNMTQANVATWQQGWKSIPAQFVQYQVKLMMNIVQSLLGNTRVFTQKEAIQLLVTHAIVMGTAGNFMWPFRDLITDVLPEDMDEEERLYVQQGVVAGMIASITDGEAKLAIGSRFNTFKFYEDVVKGLLDPEKSFMEIAAGPSGFTALRILGGFGEAVSIITKAPMSQETLNIAFTEIGKNSFSFFNNIQKSRIAMANHNVVMSTGGKGMFRVTDTEAWLLGFGIPPVAQEDLSVMYESKKAHADEIKEASKAVAKHSMLALTALRNGDDMSHKTHAAIVQVILHSYTGEDLRTLYKEAYKVEAFTQYEKMLSEQAMKQWKVNDLVVNTGVNE